MPPLPSAAPEPFPPREDRCPETASHDHLPERPCIAADGSRLWSPAIQFEPNKARLTRASIAVVESLAALLVRRPEITRLEVQGHVNAGDGSALRARRLDADRAAEVVHALVELGVAPERLTAKGYGGEVPLFPPTSEEGKRFNRRIELVVRETRPDEERVTAAPSALPR